MFYKMLVTINSSLYSLLSLLNNPHHLTRQLTSLLAEFDEFLEYAGLSGDEVIDYTKLANNFMLSKPELKMVIENP